MRNIVLSLCLLFILVQASFSKDMKNILLGKAEKIDIQKGGNQISIKTAEAFINITFYTDNIVRVRIDNTELKKDISYAVVREPKTSILKVDDQQHQLILTSKAFQVRIKKDLVRISFYTLDGQLINQDDESFGTSWAGEEITTYKKMLDGERYIGMGEKTGLIDRRGQSYTHWNTDAYAYGSFQDPLYASFPFYMGVHDELVYGIFFDSTYESEFNFGASNDRFVSYGARGGEMDYYFLYDKTVSKIIEHYTYLTGRMPLPPLWSLGYIQNRYSYYPEQEVLRIAETLRSKNIPADGMVLDIHHMENYKIFTWDKKRFPNPTAMNKKLADMGFKTTVIMDPGIKIEKGYDSYETGLKEDIFIKYPDNTPYSGAVWPGWCHFPDFTMEKGRQWWHNEMKKLVEVGVTGFWNDMNEIATWGQRMPSNVEFNYDGEGATHRKARNVYGLQMTNASYHGAKKQMEGKRPFLLTRSGYAGTQRYSALWTGDNRSESDHMLAGVRLLNNLGLVGISFSGMDIGGFTGGASSSLYIRWIQLGAFNPYLRSHSGINTKASEPWTYGEEATEIARNYIKLRYRMMPYIYSMMYESTQNGMPIQRSLAINYTHDPKIYEWPFVNQFLFGNALLVVPIEPNKSMEKVYFPAGKWYDLYKGKLIEGNAVSILDLHPHKLPVYVKESSIIPMQSQVYHAGDKNDGTMYLHIYQGDKLNSFMYYEDDGETFDYEKSKFYKRNIIFNPENRSILLQKTEGVFKTKFTNIKFILHGFEGLQNVNYNKKKINLKNELLNHIIPVSKFDPTGGSNPKDNEKVKTFSLNNSNNKIEINW